AKGVITFVCKDGEKIKEAIDKTIATGEGQTLVMTAEGFNEEFESVSQFEYTWSVKVKN
ncbi:MAG: thioesterase, partial [Bacteroidetes bacterium]